MGLRDKRHKAERNKQEFHAGRDNTFGR
jgi:hypothetical protein